MSVSLYTRFTCGDCHILAAAIHRATGWQIATFEYEGEPDAHAFIRMPDGRYLDIEGVHTRKEIVKKWRDNHYDSKRILHFDSLKALERADPAWTETITWPSSPEIAEKTARKLLWHGH